MWGLLPKRALDARGIRGRLRRGTAIARAGRPPPTAADPDDPDDRPRGAPVARVVMEGTGPVTAQLGDRSPFGAMERLDHEGLARAQADTLASPRRRYSLSA